VFCSAVGLREADDRVVWEWAKQNGFALWAIQQRFGLVLQFKL
jgi:predicted nuclease of predicted toxin-antitoxin system